MLAKCACEPGCVRVRVRTRVRVHVRVRVHLCSCAGVCVRACGVCANTAINVGGVPMLQSMWGVCPCCVWKVCPSGMWGVCPCGNLWLRQWSVRLTCKEENLSLWASLLRKALFWKESL